MTSSSYMTMLLIRQNGLAEQLGRYEMTLRWAVLGGKDDGQIAAAMNACVNAYKMRMEADLRVLEAVKGRNGDDARRGTEGG